MKAIEMDHTHGVGLNYGTEEEENIEDETSQEDLCKNTQAESETHEENHDSSKKEKGKTSDSKKRVRDENDTEEASNKKEKND